MVYEPGFAAPAWAKKAVIYQIFPDRFRNGRSDNDPKTGDVRYDDPVAEAAVGHTARRLLPQLRRRRRPTARGASTPRRPTDSPTKSTARPRLHGRRPEGRRPAAGLPEVAGRQHASTSTRSSTPARTTATTRRTTSRSTRTSAPRRTGRTWSSTPTTLGIRIILDGVFNHMSSDSPFFDRYHHYATVGACESTSSPYRSWFTFHDVAPGTGTCAGQRGRRTRPPTTAGSASTASRCSTRVEPGRPGSTSSPAPTAIAKHWLNAGARGWRLDVMGDPSFPDGYWETFRSGREGDQARRADHQRDVAEGQHAAAHAARRPRSTRP